MITHLISCTEFVKLVVNPNPPTLIRSAGEFDIETANRVGLITRYANFISQKPTLEMFVEDKALFKGFIKEQVENNVNFDIIFLGGNSIEELVSLTLELTPLALKEIYG